MADIGEVGEIVHARPVFPRALGVVRSKRVRRLFPANVDIGALVNHEVDVHLMDSEQGVCRAKFKGVTPGPNGCAYFLSEDKAVEIPVRDIFHIGPVGAYKKRESKRPRYEDSSIDDWKKRVGQSGYQV